METLAAPRDPDHRLEPGSRVTLMLRNARLAKFLKDMREREEEEPDYGDYEREVGDGDYDLESLGGIEGLQDALKLVNSFDITALYSARAQDGPQEMERI